MTVAAVPQPDLVDGTGYDEMVRLVGVSGGSGRPPRPPLVAVAAGWPNDGAASVGNFIADTYNEMREITNHAVQRIRNREMPLIASAEVADISSSIPVAAGPEAVPRLRGRLNAQAQRMAFKVASLAALIAGPAHPWALEAWRAELAYRPSEPNPGCGLLGSWSRLIHALSLLLWGAPRLRVYYPRRDFAIWAGRRFDKILTSDIKTALAGLSALPRC